MQVNIQFCLLITNDYLNENKSRSWFRILQSFIRFESRVIPSAAAFMYFLSGKMLLIYYKQIILDSKILLRNIRLRPIEKILALQMKKFSILAKTAQQLQHNLGLLNFFNVCYIVINLFISAFYIIAYSTINGKWFAFAVHTTSFIENWVRLYFLCNISEDIKSSVSHI